MSSVTILLALAFSYTHSKYPLAGNTLSLYQGCHRAPPSPPQLCQGLANPEGPLTAGCMAVWPPPGLKV